MKGIIFSANTKMLDEITPTVPSMESAMVEWFQNIVFTKIQKTVQNYNLIETPIEIVFQGIVENMKPQDLSMRPEGQRKWRWISVWATPDLALDPDDVFRYNLVDYRVMSKNDWSVYGYVQYECMEDYTP